MKIWIARDGNGDIGVFTKCHPVLCDDGDEYGSYWTSGPKGRCVGTIDSDEFEGLPINTCITFVISDESE